MSGGRLYISYGVTRSGSTLAFNLALRLLRLAGYPQRQLPAPLVPDEHGFNYINEPKQAHLAATRPGELLAIKTHGAPDEAAGWLRAGQALGHLVVRDPCAIALSLLGAGRLARTEGGGFAGIDSLETALAHLRTQDRYVAEWVAQPNMLLLRYDELARDPAGCVGRMARQVGIRPDTRLLRQVAAVAGSSVNPSTAALAEALSDRDQARIRAELPTLTRLAAVPARRSLLRRLLRR